MRRLVTLLMLSTCLLIPNLQSMPISTESLLKASNSTKPSTRSVVTSSAFNESVRPNFPAWKTQIASIPTPHAGCFTATYPSTVWQATQCVIAPSIPLRPSPSTVGGSSSTTGNGNDEVAHAPSGKLIGSSIGSFQTSGLTSETDSMYGANNYGIQINSQFFTTSTTYTGGKSTTGWEQFVWINWPAQNSAGYEYIQYWLIDYKSSYGSCPSTGPPGGSSWMVYSGDCYANSPGATTPLEAATNLGSLSLQGFSDYNGVSNDVDMFCVSGSCYDVSITDQVVNLYQNWQYSEFNVLGVGSGSQANFNAGTTITVTNALKDQSANVIVPSCANTGYTAETNDLNLGTCSSNSNGQIVFTESNQPTETLTTGVSGQGSVNPNCPSGCSEFAGSSQTVTATASSGWLFSSWSISGVSCSSGSSINPCTFTMPSNAVTVTAVFSQIVTTTQTSTSRSTSTTSTTTLTTSTSLTTTTTTSVSTSITGQICTTTGTATMTSTIIQAPTTLTTTSTTTTTSSTTTGTSTSLTVTSSTRISTTITTTTITECTQTSSSTTTSTTLTTFTRPSTSITLSTSSSPITVGSSVTLSGSISPNPGAVMVTISLSADSGATWTMLLSVMSDNTGSYSTTWTPADSGNYLLEASWSGNNQYAPSQSSTASLQVTGSVQPMPTVLLSYPASVTHGQTSTLTITVFNPTGTTLNANVAIEITGPNNYVLFDVVQIQVNATSHSAGYYVWIVPAQTGTYTVMLSYLPAETGGVDTETIQVT